MGGKREACPLYITAPPLGSRQDNKKSVENAERSQSPRVTEDLKEVEEMLRGGEDGSVGGGWNQ